MYVHEHHFPAGESGGVTVYLSRLTTIIYMFTPTKSVAYLVHGKYRMVHQVLTQIHNESMCYDHATDHNQVGTGSLPRFLRQL